MNRQLRWVLIAASTVVGVWLLAGLGYMIAQNAKVTADKVEQYLKASNFSKLSGIARAEALHKLEDMINALSLEERRKWRRDGLWREMFSELTEAEKAEFLDATLPSGFKQWLGAFEDMPGDRRKKLVDDLMKNLKESGSAPKNREPGNGTNMFGTNAAPELSPELQQRVAQIGLKTFYTESSAETKAQMAPFLEELQHQMETGRGLR